MAYYPTTFNLATLNAETPWNRFANWEGDSPNAFKSRVLASGAASAAQKGDDMDGTWAVTKSASTTGSSGEVTDGQEAEQRIWASQTNQLPAASVVPDMKWTQVERLPGAGWVQDEKERVRMEEVEMKRAMGRGPPKKGTSLYYSYVVDQELYP